MKKILIPTDLSTLADFAYVLANKIATQTGAKIELLSVVNAPADAVFAEDGSLTTDEGEDYSNLIVRKNEIEASLKTWIKTKPEVENIEVTIGSVKDTIIKYIEDHNIDMVVMGTEGAHGLFQILKTTHAEQIMKVTPVPVLYLKCDRSDIVINDILFVSDFKDVGKLDLTILKEIQNAFSAKINLLKINTPTDFESNNRVKTNMQLFAEDNELSNLAFHIYNDDSVEKGIINFCNESGIDFVSLGTHQRKGLSRLFRDNISEDVVNHIYQPIMIFPV